MKAYLKNSTYNKNTTICAWVAFYGDDGSYHELTLENEKLNNLPANTVKHIDLNHDITVLVSPGDMVGVFAKHAMDIVYYTKYFYGTAELKAMLGEYTDNEMVECTVTHLTKVVDPKESRYLR